MGTNQKARRSCGDGTHKVEHGIPGQFSECISASSEMDAYGQVIKTQSDKFEGSRLSQCGVPARQSMHACVPPYPLRGKPGVNPL